jgi:hypothetical protein
MGGGLFGQLRAVGVAQRPARIDAPVIECIGILALCPILLSVALWNGFPITFYDTGAYLAEGLRDAFMVERSAAYSFFLRFSGAAISLWLVVGLQTLMTAFVITETARAETPGLRLWVLLATGAGLAVGTGLPWYTGQIEPDCMTAIAVLATYLVGFRASRLGWVRCAFLVAVGAVATAAHTSHLGLTAGLVIFVLLVRIVIALLPGRRARPKPALALLIFLLGLGIVFASNFALTRGFFVSRAGSVFVFGRLLQDGIVKRLLDDTCPQSGYALCAYKDKLPATADIWLWGVESPFHELDGFDGTRDESTRIIADSLVRYPGMHAGTALQAAALQFVTFKTGDQIEPQQWILYPDIELLLPDQLSAYMHARQQMGPIPFGTINLVHRTVALLSLLGLLFLVGMGVVQRRWDAIALPAFIFVALLGNAMICGILSNPHDRYQSRLIWLPSFALALAVSRPVIKDRVRNKRAKDRALANA